MHDFIIFFLLFWWVMLIYYKLNMSVRIYNKLPYKTIDSLTNCQFCQESHIATILAFFYFLYSGESIVLIYGFMAAALSNLLK